MSGAGRRLASEFREPRFQVGGDGLGHRGRRPRPLERRAAAGEMDGALISMSDALLMPEVRLSADEAAAVAHGQAIARRGEWRSGEFGKLCSATGALEAVGEYEAVSGLWQPRVVMSDGRGERLPMDRRDGAEGAKGD